VVPIHAHRSGFGRDPVGFDYLGPFSAYQKSEGHVSTATTPKPRSLADDLRSRSEAELTQLFLGRPDLAHPVPADITGLARRATATPSVSRALDQLSGPQLHVLYTLRAASMSMTDITKSVDPAIEAETEQIVASLRVLGLVWGHDDSVSVVTSVRESLTESFKDALTLPTLPKAKAAGAGVQDLQLQAGLIAHNFLALMHDALYVFRVTPLIALRTGGVSTREVDRLAEFLQIPESETCLLLEVAHAAGLIALTTSLQWELTTKYETWRSKSREQQWVVLAQSWLDLPLIGSENTKPLGSTQITPAIGVMRWQTLRTLAWWNDNTPASPVKERKIFDKALEYFYPRRRSTMRNGVAKVTLAEAELIGIAHGGVMSEAGIEITLDHPTGAAKSLALPQEIDHILIQGDLTVIAPGPLPLDVSEKLHEIAEIESRGAASVYRFTANSIKRGFESGWTEKSFEDFFTQWVKGSIPQPLTYLVQESAGTELVEVDDSKRANIPPRLGRHSRRVTEAQAQRIASALLRGESEHIEILEPEEVFSLNTSALIAMLKSAQEHHTGVWIGYAEADGSTSTQIVEPIRMGDGTLTAFDHATANIRTFAISRVTGIAPARMQEPTQL